ncbi:hypothetical protein [Methylobacterium sp. SyP6R]|uniref:hypothetical protein n=1 Tax=Methylobacterium sp. SyP6R TaxID=2718876 RepID=UPI001F2E0FE5|nr:hypothetical protein [Methylobacterium sp. SyP6R]MCF4125023.1 hypothetical protein [Methylobacterium sp. SyP6R]
MDQDNASLAGGDTKPWWASRTIIGAGIGLAGLGLAAAGYQIDAATQSVLIDQTTAWVSATAALAGTVMVIIGRIAATKTIGKR